MINRRKRRDGNHTAITEAFQALGYATVDCSQLGGDVPDLLICKANDWAFIEIKAGKRKVTEGQQEFAARWPGRVRVVRTVDDVLAL